MNKVNTSELYSLFKEYNKICIDSRKAEEGSIFFALKGDNFDGNKYAQKALEKCAYAVVDDSSVVADERYILVNDTLNMLQRLAGYHRKRLGIPVLAITGTNGKTTTKELVASVLSKKYNVAYTQGNLNNHIGVPLTLLSVTKEHNFAVIEMGANHIGEIAELCKIAAPDFGIITNVGKAHLEGFGSFDGVKKAKAELYNYLYENDGLAFVNYDNENLEEMRPPHSIIYYGTRGFTHCQGKLINNSSSYVSVLWHYHDKHDEDHLSDIDVEINSKLVGDYNFENILAAIAVGYNFGIDKDKIVEAIENYVPNNNRSQVIETVNNKVIMDGYNANPTSMKVSVDSFSKQLFTPKMLILGDMLELGYVEQPEHNIILEQALNSGAEQCIFVGTRFAELKNDRALFFNSSEELVEHLSKKKYKGYNILIKGSRGIKLENAIAYL